LWFLAGRQARTSASVVMRSQVRQRKTALSRGGPKVALAAELRTLTREPQMSNVAEHAIHGV
jgi:hypothetical protein